MRLDFPPPIRPARHQRWGFRTKPQEAMRAGGQGRRTISQQQGHKFNGNYLLPCELGLPRGRACIAGGKKNIIYTSVGHSLPLATALWTSHYV